MNNSALQRLAHKAGATRVSSDVYDTLRSTGEQYLTSVVKYAIIYCEHENKKVVSEDHAIHGIEHVGFSGMYRVSGTVKTCKVSTKKKLIARIKEYQNQHDCVTLAKATIEHQIKTIGSGFKWSKEALINIHFALEYVLYQLLFSALKVTVNAKRITMLDSDVDLTIDLITTNCKNIRI
jgi:histone H3/H4